MVRARGSSSSSRPAAAPARAAPAAPARQATPAHNNTNASANNAQQPQVTNIYVQRQAPPMGGGMGGGMMGGGGPGLMGTMASVAVGSVVGHGISNMLFSKNDPPAAPEQVQQVAQAYSNTSCSPYVTNYDMCLKNNNNNAEACKWAWDSFMQCQEQLPKQA